MSDTEGAASYDTPADAGKPPRGIVSRWIKELTLAGKLEKDWRKAGQAVIDRFRDEKQMERGAIRARKLGSKFNILRPNTRVMKAAIYQQPPKPDVRRRFKDKDPLGKAVSEVMERSLSFNMDKYDLDGTMKAGIHDMLLPGRAVTRVRYEATTIPQVGDDKQPMMGADGQPQEQVQWEKICWDQVQWDDFRHGPARAWKFVPWVAYRHRLTRAEALKKIPEAKDILEKIELDVDIDTEDEREKKSGDSGDQPDADVFRRLTLWEIWDKSDPDQRQVLFIAPAYKDKPLAVREDPLGLEDFFDCAPPLYAVYQSDTLEPIEDFRAYADQAAELDNITKRIDGLVSALKVRGIYNATIKQMGDIMSSEENTLLPSEETAALINDGGLEKAIWLMPIDMIAKALVSLYEQREQVKAVIYEITGLSDIMRGQTKASETATAQSIKAQNGAVSIQDRRNDVKRYGRDLVRIGGEIIAEHFQPETLKAMSGSDYPTEQEKQQIQAQLQQMQMMAAQAAQQQAMQPPQPGMPPQAPQQPPIDPQQLAEMQKRLAMPSWEQIIQVMRSDALRSYRVDVETDETAFGDQAAEQQAVTELMQGVTAMLQGLVPLVQAQAITPEFVKSMLGVAVRRFKTGREIEDAIEELGDEAPPMPADPNAGKIDVEKQKLQQTQAQHDQKMGFERERHTAEMARAAKQDQAAEARDAFAKQQHGDEMQRRDQEIAFNQTNAGEERQSRERMAELKTRPAANIMVGSEGKVADMAEGTQGVAAAVTAMTEAVTALMQANIQAEARQTQAIAQMGAAIGQAIIDAANQPKVVKRGNDGKIKAILPAPAPAGASAN